MRVLSVCPLLSSVALFLSSLAFVLVVCVRGHHLISLLLRGWARPQVCQVLSNKYGEQPLDLWMKACPASPAPAPQEAAVAAGTNAGEEREEEEEQSADEPAMDASACAFCADISAGSRRHRASFRCPLFSFASYVT